jgi:predicted transcriptional regulator of viral defense system
MKTKMETLLLNNQTVFTVDDLAVLWEVQDRSKLWENIKYYLRRGRLKSIQRGIYAISDDYSSLEAGIKIFSPAYISYITALSIHGAFYQYSDEIHLMARASKTIELPNGQVIIYHQTKDEILLNLEGITKVEGYWLASLERAICDTSYLVPSFVFEYMNQADPDELLRLSKIYANKALARRIEKLVDARVG